MIAPHGLVRIVSLLFPPLHGASGYVAAACLLLAITLNQGRGFAQPANPGPENAPASTAPAAEQPPAAPPPPADPPVAANRPGLIEELGKIIGNPAESWGLRSPGEALNDLGARTKDAADGLSQFTRSRIVSGRVICPTMSDGKANCQIAADLLCQTKGFSAGKSLQADSAQVCKGAAIIASKKDETGACRVDHFVTSAMCQ